MAAADRVLDHEVVDVVVLPLDLSQSKNHI
jgi:hypothetical protein